MSLRVYSKVVRPLVLIGCVSLLAFASLAKVVFADPPGRPALGKTSNIVAPPPTIPLKFAHAKHPPGDFECEQCHPLATTSIAASDRLRPTKKACLDCHDEAAVPKDIKQRGQKNTKPCQKCHTAFDGKGIPTPVRWKQARLRFSHKVHAARKIACTTCHKGVGKSKPADGLHMPTMKLCLDCHKKHRRAPSRCVSCHERVPGGRMRTRYPEGSLKPGPSLPALNHGPLFGRNHKTAARGHRKQCDACHQRATCLRCHGGIKKPASIHLGNYILRHGREARANRNRCKSCHTRSRFCVSCHKRSGVSPSNKKSPFVTPGVKRFHGAKWASTTRRGSAANRHATHARRNLGTCVSCHQERDCIRCHSRRRIGGLGRSPHRPGFGHSRRCKIQLKKNIRACIKCHGFNDPLMVSCQ